MLASRKNGYVPKHFSDISSRIHKHTDDDDEREHDPNEVRDGDDIVLVDEPVYQPHDRRDRVEHPREE